MKMHKGKRINKMKKMLCLVGFKINLLNLTHHLKMTRKEVKTTFLKEKAEKQESLSTNQRGHLADSKNNRIKEARKFR